MIRGVGIAAAVLAFSCTGAARAEPYTYIIRGEALVRSKPSGQILEAQDLRAGSDGQWRKVFEIAPGDDPMRKLVCDPTSASHCYAGVAQDGADRLTWWPVDLLGPIPAHTNALMSDQPRDIEDIDLASDEVLFIARTSSAPKPDDIPPGYYLVKGTGSQRERTRLGPLPDNPASINHLAFLRNPSGPPDILVLNGGALPTVTVVNGDLSTGQSASLPSAVRAIDGRSLLMDPQSASIAAYDLGRVSFPPREPGPWSTQIVYAASSEHPSLAFFTNPNDSSGTVAALPNGRVYAVVDDGAGPRLMSLCGRAKDPREAQVAFPFAAQLRGAAGLFVSASGGDHAVVTVFDSWGSPSFWLLSDTSKGEAAAARCGGDSASLEPLPPGEAATLPALTSERRSVAADDGETISYTIIAERDAKGPVMIRVYGGGGLAVLPAAETPFEREWLRRGGRLVLPVLRGDAKLPWWNKPLTQPDYQERATRDGLLVAQDLVSRQLAEPGRLTVLGMSHGAFTAAKMTLTRPELFETAVLASGDLDPSVASAGRNMIGPAEGGFDRWFGAAKASGACANPRFVMVTGAADPLTPFQKSLNFANYTKSLGYRGQLQVMEKSDHQMMQRDQMSEVIFKDLDEQAKARAACSAKKP
jgi:predicted esterase